MRIETIEIPLYDGRVKVRLMNKYPFVRDHLEESDLFLWKAPLSELSFN